MWIFNVTTASLGHVLEPKPGPIRIGSDRIGGVVERTLRCLETQVISEVLGTFVPTGKQGVV